MSDDGERPSASRPRMQAASEGAQRAAAQAGPQVTRGCLSIGKTGSMALAAAIRDAGFPDALHLHYLGPRAIAIKQAAPEPMLDLAIKVAERIADPDHGFRFVTCVRDPIAQILSQAFYRSRRHLEATGVDIVRDREALIAWWEGSAMARMDLWGAWFDDTYKTTFGFDFRDCPFDHARKSLRFESGRLRLLILRQEDQRTLKESGIGWLLDRPNVRLPIVNDAKTQNYEDAYRPFLETFKAPSSWLDRLYDTDVMRHFYTDHERAAFQARWSRAAS